MVNGLYGMTNQYTHIYVCNVQCGSKNSYVYFASWHSKTEHCEQL